MYANGQCKSMANITFFRINAIPIGYITNELKLQASARLDSTSFLGILHTIRVNNKVQVVLHVMDSRFQVVMPNFPSIKLVIAIGIGESHVKANTL